MMDITGFQIVMTALLLAIPVCALGASTVGNQKWQLIAKAGVCICLSIGAIGGIVQTWSF